MTEVSSTSGATAATETAVPGAAVAAPAQVAAPVDASVAMAAMAAATAAPSAPAAPVGPTAAAIAAANALAAIEAAAAKKADKADKADSDSDETSMSDAEMLPEVELASLGEGGTAAAGQAGLPCGVLPVVDAPVAEMAPPVEVPVGDSGFAFSPVLLGLLGLGALGLGYLLLKGDKDDEDDNEAPVAANDTAAVAENATATGSVATNDSDPDGDSLTYTVSGTAPAGFVLNTNGTYTFDASNAAYPELAVGVTQVVNVNYVVTDPDGASDTATLAITITGVNAAPTVTTGATATVAENAPITTVIYDAAATDPENGVVTFSLAGPDAALFAINSSTGVVTLLNPANFEADASYNITIVGTDPAGATDTQDVVVSVTNVNEAPDITTGAAATVAENTPATTVVYDANAVDPEGGVITYSLSGADAALLSINATTGEVRLLNPADFEADASYSFNVIATDPAGNTDTQAVVLSVTDVPDALPVLTVTNAVAVNENIPTTTVVVDAAATDPDGGTVTFSLSGADAAAFTIDAATGEVRFVASPNFEADASYAINIVATDNEGATDTEAVAITINDLVEITTFSLDVDNDANTLTPFEIDAGTAVFQFTDNNDIANNVELINFGATDVIVFDAPMGTVAFSSQNTGDGDGLDDLLITINNGGVVSEIRIEDVATGIVFDEATAEAAIAGTNNFQFA